MLLCTSLLIGNFASSDVYKEGLMYDSLFKKKVMVGIFSL